MTLSEIWLGQGAFLVRARGLPSRTNQRPGITVLLAEQEPLHLEIEGRGQVSAAGFVLAPQVQRRFVAPQPHMSLTLEPQHSSYASYLAWARSEAAMGNQLLLPADTVSGFAATLTQQALDAWLVRLLHQNGRACVAPSKRLAYLFALLEGSAEDTTAEALWLRFNAQYPASQAHHCHWLQNEIGISLRQLILWRKLRRAMSALQYEQHATRIAHEVGFADSAHLARTCQRAFGLRPSEAANHKILQVKRLAHS